MEHDHDPDMLSKMKSQLKKKHPSWSEEEVEKHMKAILKMMDSAKPMEKLKKTENGEIIVGENVKLVLTSDINIIE